MIDISIGRNDLRRLRECVHMHADPIMGEEKTEGRMRRKRQDRHALSNRQHQSGAAATVVRRFEFLGDDRVILRPVENENVLTWERVK